MVSNGHVLANIDEAFWPQSLALRNNTMTFCALHRICRFSCDAVDVIAGGSFGFADGAGEAAKFNCPLGAAVCADGSIVVADYGNHRVRKISPDGVVSTLAGSGESGLADGPGPVAKFRFPHGIATRPDGTILVADSENSSIRQISADGVVSTLASHVSSFVRDKREASFIKPTDIAVCPDGAVLVCDGSNQTIDLIETDGTISTVAGSIGNFGCSDGFGSEATFMFPQFLAVDCAGHAVVGDEGGVRKIVLATGEVTTVAEFKDKDSAPPVWIDSNGGIIFGHQEDHTLRRIANVGLGVGYDSAFYPPSWTPTRLCYTHTPRWGREAVCAVLQVWAWTSAPARKRRSRAVLPMLPLEVWYLILMQLPIHAFGRRVKRA